jgi:hypothetical protein
MNSTTLGGGDIGDDPGTGYSDSSAHIYSTDDVTSHMAVDLHDDVMNHFSLTYIETLSARIPRNGFVFSANIS